MNARPQYEVADVFRSHAPSYVEDSGFFVSSQQRSVLRALVQCRTAALGGHVEECDNPHCHHQHIAYNSCRNRHCPKCQSLARARWLEQRKSELLPVEYFHVVFTVPASIAAVALPNQSVVYNILFRTAGQTLKTIAADPKHLGAEIGYLAVLHTWGQNLSHHPHVHCVVPGGGLSPDGTRWISTRKGFFLPVRVLSRLFRGLFLDSLRQAHAKSQLEFPDDLAHLADPEVFSQWLAGHYETDWVVYAKRPFAGPEQVLEYLGRYTHRVAISNQRLQDVTESEVAFRWKDYRKEGQNRILRLEPYEFIRRFLQHVLPPGFVRIRHGGFLANKHRRAKIDRCRELLQAPAPAIEPIDWQALFEKLTGHPIDLCKRCGQGRMVIVETLPKQPMRLWRTQRRRRDTS